MNSQGASQDKTPQYDVAIIGAGLAGSLCAHQLSLTGYAVCVIDKSRGSGGRASSKRLINNGSCDLGAPFVHATQAITQKLFAQLAEIGVVLPWQAASLQDAPAYVGVPKMSAITRHWLGDTDFITNKRVHHIEKDEQGTDNFLRIRDDKYQTIVLAKRVIITAPAAQAAAILASMKGVEELLIQANRAAQSNQPQWAMWLETQPSSFASIIAPQESPISRLIKDSDKPHRHSNGTERWVIQAGSQWTKHHLDANKESVSDDLINAFINETQLTPINKGEPHRWLLGRVLPNLQHNTFMQNTKQNVYVAGDWLCQGDGEGALISAFDLCEQIKQQHT